MPCSRHAPRHGAGQSAEAISGKSTALRYIRAGGGKAAARKLFQKLANGEGEGARSRAWVLFP